MFLSKIELNPDPAKLVELIPQLRDLYHEHQLMWNVMPEDADADRDFLYRRDDSQTLPFFYLLSKREPKQDMANLQVKTQHYDPQLKVGDQLYFELRANAVKNYTKQDSPTSAKRKIRRDIIDVKVDEYRRKQDDSSLWPPKAQLHQEAGQEWINKQGEKSGFEVQNIQVTNHQYHQFSKPKKTNDSNQRWFSSIDFTGKLQITDSEAFVNGPLFSGIGRAKAYGCGLMLIRRA